MAYDKIIIAESGAEARRLAGENDFELAIINAPLPDEFGHELSLMLGLDTDAGVILLVKSELAQDISDRVEVGGVFVVPKPISRAFFFNALKITMAARRKVMTLQRENVKLQTKIEEIRIIDRAKCALIQYLNMTEQQAHRYIEKQAMDMRITKREVADGILQTYE